MTVIGLVAGAIIFFSSFFYREKNYIQQEEQYPFLKSIGTCFKNRGFIVFEIVSFSVIFIQTALMMGLSYYFDAEGVSYLYCYLAMFVGILLGMCLRSTYHDEAGERHSNVVAWLPEGSIVTIPKNYQMYIVTEYGLADIYLKTMPDRIRAMIRIAHPDYREGLKEKILTTSLVTERDFEDYELFEQTAAPAAAEA